MTELQRLAALSSDWDWSKCAVIAREWKYLDPVRAFCELHRIPVQMGNEEIPSFWHLRETRTLVEWLRGRETQIVGSADLRGWLDAQAPGPWNDLLRQALDEHSLETSDAEMPVDHFIEWLAEWGRDIRRRQRGLLLLTAHRAKGLEFDHVAVLDGGWDKVDKGEDPDAPRRLYYVARPADPCARAFSRIAPRSRYHAGRFRKGACTSGVLGPPAPAAVCLSEQWLGFAPHIW